MSEPTLRSTHLSGSSGSGAFASLSWVRCILLGTSFGQRKSEIAYFDVLTFWPSFAIFRNDLGNWDKVKDIVTLRPATSTEFRSDSCCSSQIGWGPHICKVLSGCIIAHSKTPINLRTTCIVRPPLRPGVGVRTGWAGVGVEVGVGVGYIITSI